MTFFVALSRGTESPRPHLQPLFNGEEILRTVAAITGLSEAAPVRIIPAVTADAGHGHFDLVLDGLPVTLVTLELLVLPREVEIRLLVVVKSPDIPSVGVMARNARLPKTPLMLILRLVAPDALDRCLPVQSTRMALLAGHDGVKSDQGKPGDVVLENNLCSPALRRMASLALTFFLPRVNVVELVTGETLQRKVFLREHSLMAGIAVHFLVFSLEREFCPRVIVL